MATISGKNDHAAGFFISESPAYNGVKNTHACILFGKFLKSKFFRLFRTVEVGRSVQRLRGSRGNAMLISLQNTVTSQLALTDGSTSRLFAG